ncbi:MAG: DNA-directed RNA polymerase subunit omega [Acidobacteriaceae bacterium]|nr:DNA-directed RNA polymerase subunit omega [Acidobacteriaceae bacterium]
MMTDDSVLNRYSLVKAAARRARQLQNGAPPRIAVQSTKPCRIAQDEIEQGQVGLVISAKPREKTLENSPLLWTGNGHQTP